MKNLKTKIPRMSLKQCEQDITEALTGTNLDWQKKFLKNGLEAKIPLLTKEIKEATNKEPTQKELIQLFAYQMYIQLNQIKLGKMTDQEFLDKAKKEFKEQL